MQVFFGFRLYRLLGFQVFPALQPAPQPAIGRLATRRGVPVSVIRLEHAEFFPRAHQRIRAPGLAVGFPRAAD